MPAELQVWAGWIIAPPTFDPGTPPKFGSS